MLSYFTQVIYVQISPDWLTVRNTKTGKSFSDVPEVAIANNARPGILGVDKDARTHTAGGSVQIVNRFAHPRSMVSDFTVAGQVLKAFILRVSNRSLLAPAIKVVMHPQGEPAGGFTQVEARAFHEMALGAGAAKATVWRGRNLSDQELRSGKFPSGNAGEVLS